MPSRVADLDELRALLVPLRDAGKGVVALLPGGRHPQRRAVRPPARGRPADHLDGAAHGQGLPVPREGGRRERRRPGRRGRGVAPGLVPAPRVPDEPGRAVHPQHRAPASPSSWASTSTSAWPPTATRRGGPPRGTSSLARRAAPVQLAVGVGGRVGVPPRARGPGRRGPRRGAGVHAPRRHARHLARRRPEGPLLVGARQRRPRRASPGCCRATTSCWVWPTRGPTCRSCATPVSPPTCSATGCATAKSCRSSGPCTSSPPSRPACTG